MLLCPANERLEGTQFTPGECAKHLAPGTNLIYPPQVIDGLVHGARGDSSSGDGADLAAAIAALPTVEVGGVRCPTGGAVSTAAYGELRESYIDIVHCAAPFFGPDRQRWRGLLLSCFSNAFAVAEECGAKSIAVPLLGAGARGAPADEVATIAAASMSRWDGLGSLRLARVAVQDEEMAHLVTKAMDAAIGTRVDCDSKLSGPWAASDDSKVVARYRYT